MNLKEKIKELLGEKKKTVRIIFAVEAFLLLAGVIGLFGKDAVYEYGQESMRAYFGTCDEKGGYTVNEADGQKGCLVDFGGISLPKGVYSVAVRYETDTNMKNICTVADETLSYRLLRTNGEHLYAGLDSTDFNMWLLQSTTGLTVRVEYGGEGSLTVKGLAISETNALNRIYLFWIIVGSALFNLIYVCALYDRKYGFSAKDKTVVFGLALVTLFASLPLMQDYMLSARDLAYHLMRIEGIKDSILNGMFPARNAPEWQQGYGYASAIFYGETLLYIAAALRLIGFSVVTSYRLFFFLMTVAQVLIAYFCFRKVFGEKYVGLLCSMLYTLSVYRSDKLYGAGAFGEAFGVLFLPFLAYGFYGVFTRDIKGANYKRSWIPLTIGFSGLLQSHLLTCEMAGFFTILLCLIEIKKVFRRETFLVLGKTVVYTCLLSAWYLVPFLDYMLTGNFVIQNVSARTIQNSGLYLSHLLLTFPGVGGSRDYENNGMVGSDPTTVGAALIAVLFIWFAVCFFRKNEGMNREYRRLGWIAAGFGTAALAMSLSAFPWDEIHSWNQVTRTLVSTIQYPYRWLSIASISLVMLAGVLGKWIWEKAEGQKFFIFFAGMAVLTMLSNVYLLTGYAQVGRVVRVYNSEGMGTGYISGAEYLPYGADATKFVHRDPVADEGIVLETYEKQGLTIDITCTNTGEGEALVRMPLLYYKGYVTYDTDTGESFETFADEDFFVTVAIPAGYSGSLRTCFKSPWYWRLAELVNVLFLAGLLWQAYFRRRRGQLCAK